MNEVELCPEVSRSDGQWNLVYRHTTYRDWAVEVEHEDGERRFVLVNARDGRRLALRSANSLYPALDLAAAYLNHKEMRHRD